MNVWPMLQATKEECLRQIAILTEMGKVLG